MSFFSPSPQTRFDLNFSVAGIPVRVHPLFWLIALLFGSSAGGLVPILIWVVAVFVSILLHEMGHALAYRGYGIDARILLHMAGGLAMPTGRRSAESLSLNERIFVSFAGPLAGFLLAALITAAVILFGGQVSISWLLGFIPIPQGFVPGAGQYVNITIQMFLWINVFWGLINLVPVFPLDGGRIAQYLFLMNDPRDGYRKALMLSVGAGALMAIVGYAVLGSIYIALLFGILAFQSYQMLQGPGGRF